MNCFLSNAHRALLAVSAGLGLLYGPIVVAAPVASAPNPKQATSPLLEFAASVNTTPDLMAQGNDSGGMVLNAVSRGRWTNACSIATNVLARKVADVDALGVFALCAAIRNDTTAASSAIERLREAEPSPYFGMLTQGILELKTGSPERAEAVYKTVLRSRTADPLALYFSGEALHAQRKDAEAIGTFRSVLKSWPDHAPALTAVARLLAAPVASTESLKEALVLTERATTIDPSNQAHWRLLAELCDRTGQHSRANAIALQWLSGPPKVK